MQPSSVGSASSVFVGARHFSVLSSPTSVPCLSETSPSLIYAEPEIVCAPDSFFAASKDPSPPPLVSFEGWKDLHRQFSIVIENRDYSSPNLPPLLQRLVRPKIVLHVQNTSISNIDSVVKSAVQFFSSKKPTCTHFSV